MFSFKDSCCNFWYLGWCADGRRLAKQGADLVITARRLERLEALVRRFVPWC